MGKYSSAACMREVVANQIGGYYSNLYSSFSNSLAREVQMSPIEELFVCALLAIKIMQPFGGKRNLEILPQYKIGRYRVDFMLIENEGRKLIIELDGHNFHDTTEKQRRYEKKRDRYFTAQGYKVVHFTGKEITDDPFTPAIECLSLVSGMPKDHFQFGF